MNSRKILKIFFDLGVTVRSFASRVLHTLTYLQNLSKHNLPVQESYTIGMKIISVESISEAVKTRRKQLGLTQSETAAMCNVGAHFFSELENGKETLQINKVLHCLEMLGINLYAVNREDDKGRDFSPLLEKKKYISIESPTILV